MLNEKFQVYSKISMQPLAQRLAHFLVARLAEQGEHVLFIGLHARLVAHLGPMPESEMAELRQFDQLPESLTYPQVTPQLYAQVQRWKHTQN